MEIRHLKLIKTVAEVGSLTSAGKILFLSQSALSHQLREMEVTYGVPLFLRINRKMVLTEVGKRVLKTADVVLNELDRTETDIRRLVSGDAGVLRISVGCYTCYHWLPSLIKSYSESFPNVDIKIVTEATDDPVKFLLEGKLDVGIDNCREEDGHLEYTTLFEDDLVVVANENHPLSRKAFVSAGDLENEDLIVYTSPDTTVQRLMAEAGVTPNKIIRVQLTEARIELVRAGLGLTVLARWAVKPYLAKGGLVMVPLTKEGCKRTWWAATLKDPNPPAFLQSFVSHLSKHPIV